MDLLKVFFPVIFLGRVIIAISFCVAMVIAIAVAFIIASICYLAGFGETGDKVYSFIEKKSNA